MATPTLHAGGQLATGRERVAFLVDLDGTLIPEFKGMHPDCPLRKNASSFLENLSKHGDVYLCSLATRSYAKHVLESHGIRKHFSGIIAREELIRQSGATCPSRSITFIDNDKQGVVVKLQCMQVTNPVKTHIVATCPADGEDDELIKILKEIKNLMWYKSSPKESS